LIAIRPQALNLIESFEYSDNCIANSVIGSYDGQAEKRFLEAASASRLNNKDVMDGFKEHIMPIMHARM